MSTSEDFRRRNKILLHENGTYDMPDHLQFLNNASVKKSDDVNILSTLVAFNPNLKFDFKIFGQLFEWFFIMKFWILCLATVSDVLPMVFFLQGKNDYFRY